MWGGDGVYEKSLYLPINFDVNLNFLSTIKSIQKTEFSPDPIGSWD